MGEKIAWEKFYYSFTMTYRPAITEIMRGEMRTNLRLFQARLEERIEELRDELRAKLAGGVDSLTLASLKKDCEDRGQSLAKISTVFDIEILNTQCDRGLWLVGARDESSDGDWRWIDYH